MKPIKMKYYFTNYNLGRIIFLCLLGISFSCLNTKNNNQGIKLKTKFDIPEVLSSKKKVIIRFVGNCHSCIESINEIREFCENIKCINERIDIVFYVENVDEEKFRFLKQKLCFADRVIFDSKRDFYRRNLLKYPYDEDFHLFLLNEKNELLHFGNILLKNEIFEKL